eukprot:6905348-Heterocapsa_arctica.AAC.1
MRPGIHESSRRSGAEDVAGVERDVGARSHDLQEEQRGDIDMDADVVARARGCRGRRGSAE